MRQEGDRKGLGTAAAATAALSVPLIVVPVLGPLIASWAGCRRAGRNAIGASALVAAGWGVLLWWASGHEVNVGGTSVSLGPLMLVIPAVVGGLLAGGLLATGQRGGTPIGIVVLVAGVAWTGFQFEPVVTLVREFKPAAPQQASANTGGCPENLKRLYTAARLYADSWDDMLPPPDVWMDRITEYAQDTSVFRCPAVARGSADRYGYAMNRDTGARALWEISAPADVPAFYDSTSLGRNANDAYSSLPVPGRHDGSNNVVFLDGHVKAVESP